jgi:hypothetical protein
MPSRSKSQQHAMGAALGGAQFPLAQKLRSTMSLGQLSDFASTPTKGLPSHVKASKPASAAKERSETGSSMGHPHRVKNLGRYGHPKGGY